MLKQISALVTVVLFIAGCSSTASDNNTEVKKDTVKVEAAVETPLNDSLPIVKTMELPVNDSLNAIADIMSGIVDDSPIYQYVQSTTDFKVFSKNFDKRWMKYDSTRLMSLKKFKENEISKLRSLIDERSVPLMFTYFCISNMNSSFFT
jgi:PBP1b-binding outer membrane lipoprotein LpoB